jgi:DNA-binding NtrC family response regulator
MRVLIVEDDPSRLKTLLDSATRAAPGADVRSCRAGDELDVELADPTIALVLLGPGVADGSEVSDLLTTLRAQRPELAVLVASERDDAATAVAAMKNGATDYLILRPGHGTTEVAAAAARLVEHVAPRLPPRPAAATGPLAGLVGTSKAMERVRGLVRTAARTDAHVLIEGETGTGKEVVARALHALGRRAAGPFVPINCAAVPETLAESEFFGHARGAFTGAHQERPGALQQADRGTLFLDEVEDLPLALQAKLLRVVQDREVRPLGASSSRRVDLRLVAASNRDLWRMVEAGQFRRDLYYRLRVFSIQLPPLRERREDLPLLIEHFIARLNARHGYRLVIPPAAVLRPLLEHPWPGNVRELENTLEALAVLAHGNDSTLKDALRDVAFTTGGIGDERTRILRALDEQRWNRQRAAAVLGISRVTLWRRMERHGIRDPFAAPERETA